MDIASLIIGIISAVLGFIPCCGWMAVGPAIVGLILGLVDFNRKKETDAPNGMAMAGIILNGIALLLTLGFYLLFTAGDLATGFLSY